MTADLFPLHRCCSPAGGWRQKVFERGIWTWWPTACAISGPSAWSACTPGPGAQLRRAGANASSRGRAGAAGRRWTRAGRLLRAAAGRPAEPGLVAWPRSRPDGGRPTGAAGRRRMPGCRRREPVPAGAMRWASAIDSLRRAGPGCVPRPFRLDDAGWVANRWCEILPIPLADGSKPADGTGRTAGAPASWSTTTCSKGVVNGGVSPTHPGGLESAQRRRISAGRLAHRQRQQAHAAPASGGNASQQLSGSTVPIRQRQNRSSCQRHGATPVTWVKRRIAARRAKGPTSRSDALQRIGRVEQQHRHSPARTPGDGRCTSHRRLAVLPATAAKRCARVPRFRQRRERHRINLGTALGIR